MSRSSIPKLGAALLVALLTLSCTSPDEGSPETISREAFIATYIDLRTAALDDTSALLTTEERSQILDSHGVTPDDLTRFVEVHGDRPRYLQEIWFEVEERIQEWEEGGDASA